MNVTFNITLTINFSAALPLLMALMRINGIIS